MISRETRRRRADLKKIRTIKCRHRIYGCEQFDCIKAIREDVYGGRKRKASKPVTPTVNVEELFRKLRQPVSVDHSWDDFSEPETAVIVPVSAASAQTPKPGQVYRPAEKKLTLRQLISRKAAA